MVVHLLVVALGYACVRRLLPGGSEAPAVLGATVLAAHPLGVEAVAWITSRGDLYALALGLAALLVAVTADRDGRPRLGVLAGGLAALAVLGKESAVSLPLVALAHRRLLATSRPGRPVGTWGLALGVAAALILRQVALAARVRCRRRRTAARTRRRPLGRSTAPAARSATCSGPLACPRSTRRSPGLPGERP
jgi:hypothetical protein